METNTQKPIKELSVEFLVGLLLVLYPHGAAQMGLPHFFSIGLVCWVLATGIAVRIFWIFPAWSNRLSKLEKSLISFILVAMFVAIFYWPVLGAYRKHNLEAKQQALPVQERTPPVATSVLSTPAPEPQTKTPHARSNSPSRSVTSNNGASVGSITQGAGSIAQIGGSGNTATVNNVPRPRIPEQKISPLADLLAGYRGSSVSVHVENADAITSQDATNLLTAFAKTHVWGTAGVGREIHGSDIGADGLPVPDPTGIHIYARSERMGLANSVKKALESVGVKSVVEGKESVTGFDIDILVGGPE